MIKKSRNKQYDVDKNGKHGDLAKRGWNYYDSDIVIKNGLGEYKIWQGLLNIRLDADEKDYVYDIRDIKKVSANSIKAITKANTLFNNVTPSNNVVKNSLVTDSTGKELSEGQKEFFKDSKAVDEKGNLKVMYHGTSEAEFNTFDMDMGGGMMFLTDDNRIAKTYSGTYDTFNPNKEFSVFPTYLTFVY